MKKIAIASLFLLLPAACVSPPNPAVEGIKAAREFGKLARDAQEAQARSGNGASAEVVAFQQTDARLRYSNATVVYDGRGCASYQGTTSDGRVANVPLQDGTGKRICRR